MKKEEVGPLVTDVIKAIATEGEAQVHGDITTIGQQSAIQHSHHD